MTINQFVTNRFYSNRIISDINSHLKSLSIEKNRYIQMKLHIMLHLKYVNNKPKQCCTAAVKEDHL